MFKLFKKQTMTTYEVTYKFVGEETIYTTTCTSAGFASLDADFGVEILSVK
jgi:hypothetical protein